MPETGETLIIEQTKGSDLPGHRLWLLDDKGEKTEVELPSELRKPAMMLDDDLVEYDWFGRYYPWPSHGMFLIYTSKGLYGLRGGKIWLINSASKLTHHHSYSVAADFHDLGADQEALIFGSPLGPTPYEVINEQRGVVKSAQLPFMKNGKPAEPHPDGKSVIVFGDGLAYRVSPDAPAVNIMASTQQASGAFAGVTVPWWSATLLSTASGVRLLTSSGAILRIRGMERLDAKTAYFTFSETTRRVFYWSGPGRKPFGEIAPITTDATCAN
ncbi:MAG: hypothetical protein WC829_17600 [Hyphomicrobium sp.]